MKLLRFKKGIHVIYLPIRLTPYSPWQDQIRDETKKLKAYYKVRKSARWGFDINEYGAQIHVK